MSYRRKEVIFRLFFFLSFGLLQNDVLYGDAYLDSAQEKPMRGPGGNLNSAIF